MGNQQLYINNEQTQVLLSGMLGDGHLSKPKNENCNSCYSTNCIYKDYLEFKKSLLGDLSFNISIIENNGYKKGTLYTLCSKRSVIITNIRNYNIDKILQDLDELGLALWFYDDGSLHKNKLFYNLNTHKFSYEENIKIQEFLKKFNIFSKITKEVKKDGRIFYYQRISKFEGSYEISRLLLKYPVKSYSYKIWSSETIQKWSKLQEQLKSTDKVTNKMKGILLSKITL